MSVNLSVQINADKLLGFLGRLPKALDQALDRAIAKAAFVIEGRSKAVTPVDTGRLRASIHTVNSRLRAEIGTNVSYAIYVHEGTRFMQPRPFMSEGVQASRNQIEEILNAEITGAVAGK